MNKNLLFTACLMGMLCSPHSLAKIETLTWQTELCEYQGQYDSQRFSKKQLQDTLQLIQLSYSSHINAKSFAFKPEQIQEISVEKIDQDYQNTKKQLQQLQIIAVKEFQSLKSQQLKMLDQEYQHQRLTALAFSQPQKILVQNYGQQCLMLAKALNAPDQKILLQNARQSLLRENQKQLKLGNSPEFLAERLQRFDYNLTKSNASDYARIQLILEWTNCANPLGNSSENLQEMFKQKAFIKTKEMYCDEP